MILLTKYQRYREDNAIKLKKISIPIINKTIPIDFGIIPLSTSHENPSAGMAKIIDQKSPIIIKQGKEIKAVTITFFANNLVSLKINIGTNTTSVMSILI